MRPAGSRLSPRSRGPGRPRPRRPSAPASSPIATPRGGLVAVLATGPTRPRSRRPAPVADRLLLDRRLLEGHDARRLFAYEVTPAATRHLRGVAAPGDRIVFQRLGAVTPDRICAIRTGEGDLSSREPW